MSGTDEGFSPAIVSWFFAGSDDGRDFIYSGYSTTQMLTSESQPEQMKERLNLVSGKFEIDAKPSRGTIIRALVPLKPQAKFAGAGI